MCDGGFATSPWPEVDLEGSARQRAPHTSMGGLRPAEGTTHKLQCRGSRTTCANHRGESAPLSSFICVPCVLVKAPVVAC